MRLASRAELIFWLAVALAALAGPTPAVAADVYIIEFTLDSLHENDEGLEDQLEKVLQSELARSARFESVKLISEETWADFQAGGPTRAFALVRGELVGKANSHSVTVTLEVHGESPESATWGAELPKELAALKRYFKRVSQRIIANVNDEPFKKIIFTSCFRSMGEDSDLDVERIRMNLPSRLKEELAELDLAEQYDLAALKAREVEEQCKKRPVERRGRESEFVIYGLIWPQAEGDRRLAIEVFVELLEEDDELPLEQFLNESTGPLYRLLAQHIAQQFRAKVESAPEGPE